MYFLNARNVPEFGMRATRNSAEMVKCSLARDTFITYRPLDKRELLKYFPFIKHVDAEKTTDWEHPVFSETGTWLECIPDGWQKPWFIETMLMALKLAIEEDGMSMKDIYLTDAKEKYGSLRMDFSTPVTEGHAFSDMCLAWGTCRLFLLHVRQAACLHFQGMDLSVLQGLLGRHKRPVHRGATGKPED